MVIVSLILLIVGLLTKDSGIVIASGLFGIAGSIDNIVYRLFGKRDKRD